MADSKSTNKKQSQAIPKARNNNAHTSMLNYFDRIFHSLEERLYEYMNMRKYMRLYEESQKLLSIERTMNLAAASIYEINMENKLDCKAIHQSMVMLNQYSKRLKLEQTKTIPPLQRKLLTGLTQDIDKIIFSVLQITRNIARINVLTPVIKVLLKTKDKDEDDYNNDLVLIEISNALLAKLEEPQLAEIVRALERSNAHPKNMDAKLHFEQINDVSDKLIGLLNDKLLIVIGISESLIDGTEGDDVGDIPADKRIPDELKVLFLASSVLNILQKLKEIREGIKTLYRCVKNYLQLIEHEKLETKYRALLKNGEHNPHELIISSTQKLNRIKTTIIELSPGIDAFELKLRLDTLDLQTVINMTYSLIYEKSRRTWINPYYH
ncbi:hypothetical protein [Beggiatoa leptomitoformis]|uniref:Uncharacterized protein n=1 Tax=Beggiatoa leptomitoformis TaxID=288004 RepID=A0A2N9YG88_9GAMM|nr:hypothetical protein [Beggiatoa leptomitoformis]ALG68182.1 hypothetical protein AL038_11285 [Beggiatoa leptomitoformis]AUI69514.1 hypothetical protein BLE401_12985 [Beggiatoa leptomitoformis]